MNLDEKANNTQPTNIKEPQPDVLNMNSDHPYRSEHSNQGSDNSLRGKSCINMVSLPRD